MQRDSVIALQLTPGMWWGLRDLAGADPDAAYGCVDWYLYHEPTLAECTPRSPRGEPATVIEPNPPNATPAPTSGIRPRG